MNTTYHPQPTNVLANMQDARNTCRELLHLLAEENQGLSKQRAEVVETRLQLKRSLTLRLEVLMQDLKRRKTEWQGQPAAKDLANRLAEEISLFQTLAAKNLTLLKAAHQLRADMVAVIRDTMDARTPHVPTYGRSGSIYTTDQGTRLVSRDA